MEGEEIEGEQLVQNPIPDATTGKVLEVEIRLFRSGKGPVDVFRVHLGGWDRDQIEVRDILDKYSLKSVYAFNPESGRGAPIRFNPKNGRSVLTYSDGAVVFLDGEPQDSLVMPVTKIIVGVAMVTVLIVMAVKYTPDWLKWMNVTKDGTFSPWILVCVVIAFTRIRKRTRSFLMKKFGR